MFSVPSKYSFKDVTTTCSFYPSNVFGYVNGKYENPNTLSVGKGYWFRTFNDCTVTLKGVADSNVQLNLNAGWNLIGVPNTVDVSGFEGNCNVARGPYEYDSTAKKWNRVNTLEPLKAYFVKVAGSCSMSG